MAGTTTIDFPLARALVRLRFALEHAVQLSRDPSEPGAHIAIVALDGAVEYALWLVARFFGVEPKQSGSRHDLLTKVRDAVKNAGETDWRVAGGGGVDQLHRARNDAQHAAVQFDAAQLPDWATAAHAFIDSLLQAAFGRPLSDVSLAGAVRDTALADMLARAEHDIDRPEPDAGAFLLIAGAFDEARRRWLEQQSHAYGRPTGDLQRRARPDAFGMLDDTARPDERLTDFLEVVPFASDLGEYSWFLAARRQQEEIGWTPEPADSRRALVFVCGWIVRWEVFDRGYPLDRWDEHFASLVPPTEGDASRTAVIGAEAILTRDFPGSPARCHIVVALANVPDQARGPWGNWLLQALVDGATELGEQVRFDSMRLSLTGQLLLVCKLGYEADAVARVVRRAVELTDDRHRAWSESEARRNAELQRLQEAFAEVVASARSGPHLFDTVEVTERVADGQPVVWLALNFGESKSEELGLCADGFRSSGGPLLTTGVFQDRLVFDAFELTEDGVERLTQAIRSSEELILQRRRKYRARILEFQKFQVRLAEMFPNQPK